MRYLTSIRLLLIIPITFLITLLEPDAAHNATFFEKEKPKEITDTNKYKPLAEIDTDGDGLTDDIDEDDDNDGIPDLYEDGCEVNTAFGTPPSSLTSTNYVTSIYTNYNSFWASSVGSLNPTGYDNVSELLAFKVGSETYATGVGASVMIDSDGNGLYDSMDTDGDTTGDVTLEETTWTALRPVTKIKSGIRLEGRAIDGNTSNAVGPQLTSGGIPFNPYLYEGERGLDMGYAIANIDNAWYFRLGGANTAAYGDGEMDILLTQGAQLGSGLNYNRLHLLDEDGNYLGNGVEVNWNNTPVVGNSNVDQYNVNDSSSGRNQKKNIRLAAVELSEFGLTPAERAIAVIFRLEISANADPIFFVVNDKSFITACTPQDTDGDGIVNSLDLDSDNDGIYDAIEAGHGQALVDGRLTGPVGTDGIVNSIQATGQYDNGTINYEIKDSNNDNILDFLSSDSDADGCNDVLEAGFLDGDDDNYLGTSPLMTNSWGVVTGQGGYTTPRDGNGNNVPDYQEFSSAPSILTAPQDTVIFDGNSGYISITAANTTQYQWQISTDGGTNFSDIVDTTTYSGIETATLGIYDTNLNFDGLLYRVIILNEGYVCSTYVTSEIAQLSIRVKSVITNKRITYRIKKE
ncbi:hypothetical protein Celal_0276 [Cellulophaga algicola DSM 14237]|uniref:Uncharacterized protein n=1 Tax=Cellulophaga algicola (strain DSM 14237 / IC166 / ACAM 630) TaxID=688270 RepID=E6X8N5_CELAD|nr:hypothetical protein [Cellulophaga algicola]ADV47622.1 hypothetical protein Celal_0276 [Cellulophaga algicola DSM 14237]